MQQSNPIIVEHFKDKDGNPYWLETTDSTHCATKMDFQYPMAFHRPNFPVPAIIYFVVPVIVDSECLRIEIINASGADVWPVEYKVERTNEETLA